MNNKKWKFKLVNFLKSMLFVIILGLVGFLYGINLGQNTKAHLDKNILISISTTTIIGILMYIYLKANIFNSLLSPSKKKLTKYLYFTIVFLFFVVYYIYNKDNFFKTYQTNKIGIDQNQYIFIVNFIGFLTISYILYNFILKDYSLKKIGMREIEFSEELDIADKQNSIINKYQHIINDYSNIICKIDTKMNDLNNEDLIRNDYEVEEYIIVIDEFIKEFISINNDISIIIKSMDSFEDFAREELGCGSFNIKKIKVNIEQSRVYIHNNRIYIKYKSSIINESLVLIVDMDNVYPGELGILIYSYLVSVETSYSKYLVI